MGSLPFLTGDCGPHPTRPTNHAPCRSKLRPEQAQRIASLGLYLNEPELAILCVECGFALKADSDRVSRHLGEKHGLSKKARWGLNRLINSLQLPDPGQLPPRQDGHQQHRHLTLQRGAACSHCRFRSTSYDVLSRHLKKEHRHEVKATGPAGRWLRDHIRDNIVFQSWLPGDILNAWQVSEKAPPRHTEQAAIAVRDVEAERHAEAICTAELQRIADICSSSTAQLATVRTAKEQLSPILLSNWMRRTGWETLFAEADRRFLITLYHEPATSHGSYCLGSYEGRP